MRVYTLDTVAIAAILALANTPAVVSAAVVNSPSGSPGAAHDSAVTERGLRSAKHESGEERFVWPYRYAFSWDEHLAANRDRLISLIHSSQEPWALTQLIKKLRFVRTDEAAHTRSMDDALKLLMKVGGDPAAAESASIATRNGHFSGAKETMLDRLSALWVQRKENPESLFRALKLDEDRDSINVNRLMALDNFIGKLEGEDVSLIRMLLWHYYDDRLLSRLLARNSWKEMAAKW
uniref:Uncharacterized protein n=1 Tax=Peronospora matthiolae TaxID=2874970 RepID=A0AAV1TQ30_9STRA